jgi:hypothetical protein
VVLDLLLIGLGIALEPFPLTAFILLVSAEKGRWKGLAQETIRLSRRPCHQTRPWPSR